MKRSPFTAPPPSSHARKTGFMGLLVVALLVLVLWGPRVGSAFMSGPASDLRMPTMAGAAEGSHGDFHYFRSGQWMADIRTLLAACRYVLEPETA